MYLGLGSETSMCLQLFKWFHSPQEHFRAFRLFSLPLGFADSSLLPTINFSASASCFFLSGVANAPLYYFLLWGELTLAYAEYWRIAPLSLGSDPSFPIIFAINFLPKARRALRHFLTNSLYSLCSVQTDFGISTDEIRTPIQDWAHWSWLCPWGRFASFLIWDSKLASLSTTVNLHISRRSCGCLRVEISFSSKSLYPCEIFLHKIAAILTKSLFFFFVLSCKDSAVNTPFFIIINICWWFCSTRRFQNWISA